MTFERTMESALALGINGAVKQCHKGRICHSYIRIAKAQELATGSL